MNTLLRYFREEQEGQEEGFKLSHAIIMGFLILAFIASNIYVLVSSLD